ncbi:MAG: hypothetical protein RQ715_00915 [Methylococcales bacterium]|nr:hypothetical protein [Methylococcales bacterium]
MRLRQQSIQVRIAEINNLIASQINMRLFAQHPIGLIIAAFILFAVTLSLGQRYQKIANFNHQLQKPATIDLRQMPLPTEIMMAKARQLSTQGATEQAVRVYLDAKTQATPDLALQIEYNLGSVYLAQASQLWRDRGVWEYDKINALLDLAEQALRKVLQVNPNHAWARYNLDYALAIRPPGKEVETSDWQGRKSSVYAILPGLSKGGP